MVRNFLFLLLSVTLFSCEKNIDFKLDDTQPVLVVEAEIESGLPPVVVLTRSFPFFSTVTPDILTNSFVRNAEVYVSNGTLTHRMKEYARPLAPGFFTYYYGIDSSSLGTSFVGAFNTSYTLRIVSEGKEYLSQTTIPALTWYPDTVYFRPAPLNPDTLKRSMFLRATEPAGLGNYIRYFTRKNSEAFYPGPNSSFTDQIVDGTTYTIQVEPGFNRNNPPEPGENFFRVGDTATLKFCNIDRATYTFWNTWEFSQQAIGNPFSQPNKVIGNISNGALGAFCGYAAWFNTQVVR